MSLHTKQPRSLNLPADAILTPANGKYYVDEDREHVFAQQPFGPEDASESILPDPTSTLRPPLLHYGWLIGYERLMQVVFEHFPDAVKKWHDPNFNEKDTRNASRHPTMPGWIFDANRTLFGSKFITAICKFLELPGPEECDGVDCGDLFAVALFQDSPCHADLGFSIGTNYFGALAVEPTERLKVLFGVVEEPKWYLDFYKWQWGRVHPSKTLKQSSSDFPKH